MSETTETKGKKSLKLTVDDIASRGPFATLEEAQRTRPSAGRNWKVCRVVAPDGTTFYTWAWSGEHALVYVATKQGWTSLEVEKAPGKDKMAELLALMGEDERKELLSRFAQPTPDGKKGKGK